MYHYYAYLRIMQRLWWYISEYATYRDFHYMARAAYWEKAE
jgi:hypothetical protein